jgi:hypothetical protein
VLSLKAALFAEPLNRVAEPFDLGRDLMIT